MRALLGILTAVSVVALSACGSDADPQFRIRNERATKANLQVQTSGGNTININDVQPGQTTSYQSAAAGQIVATASIQNESVSPTVTFLAETDTNYTIVVATGATPTLVVLPF